MADKGRTIKVKVTYEPQPLACKTFANTGIQKPGAAARRKKAGQSQNWAPFFGSNRITRSCSIKRERGQSQFYTSTQPGHRPFDEAYLLGFRASFPKLRSLISEE